MMATPGHKFLASAPADQVLLWRTPPRMLLEDREVSFLTVCTGQDSKPGRSTGVPVMLGNRSVSQESYIVGTPDRRRS